MVIEIPDDVREQVRKTFSQMSKPITIHAFLSEKHCLLCNETREILIILEELSQGKLHVDYCECDTDSDKAKKFEIERHPAIIYSDFPNVRFYGIPAGFEFGSLVEAFVDAANGVDMPDRIKESVKAIDKKVTIKTFVTPTCPYCPRMIRAGQRFGMVNSNILAEGIEATEYPELSQKYAVFGVPKTVINDKINIDGLVPENVIIDKINLALKE
ncbi:MAG: thioredoxin family protein [Promethearchaeota archaeon]